MCRSRNVTTAHSWVFDFCDLIQDMPRYMPKYRPRCDVMKHEHALNDNHKFYFYPLCSKVDKSIGVFWLWLHSTMVSAWKFALDSTMEKAWKMVFVEWRNVNTDLVSLFVFNSISGTFYWRGKNHRHIPKANRTYIKIYTLHLLFIDEF